VLDALSGKRKHASLGPKLVEGSEDHAHKRFDELVAQGIKPSDTVVDYGCGTLRLGVRFIDYLDADRYVGLDIDDRIIAAGRDHLRADLVEAKRPVLEVISPQSLARAWIFSNGVLPHVPPDHLNAYFTNLARLVVRPGSSAERREPSTRSSRPRAGCTMELTCKRWSRPAACS
jgi:trans-aconitate methyltransferase